MFRAALTRTCAAAVLAGLLSGPTVAAPPPPKGDGEPTAKACRAFGYELEPRDADDRRLFGAGKRMHAPPPPPPPPMPPPPPAPPPPPPTADASAQELTVTGSRTLQREYTAAAPVMAVPTVPGGPPPGTVETERYPDAQINPVKRVTEQPVSTFSIDVDTASYSNVRRILNQGRLPPRDAVRVEELLNYFDYAYPRPDSRDEPFRPFVAVTPSPWAKGKEIVHIGLQGYDVPERERPPLNLVFLVDVSGSMQGEDRLELAKKALNVLIDQLRPQDSVAMAVYAGAAGSVLEPTSGREKLKMRCALQALTAGGSTAGGAGLTLAYKMAEARLRKDAVNRVILLTDGDFNVGVADPEKLEDFVAEKRQTGVYLSIYGFGGGNYNDALMQTLAQAGNGTAAYVDTLAEGRKVFRDDFGRSLFPIADDVKIQVEFNPAVVSEYRLIGYETRLLNREDFNNDRVDAGEVGSGASVTALYEITSVGGPASVDPLRYQPEPAAAAGSAEIAFLRVRWKAPGASTSRLLERPIGPADRRSLERAPEATRLALAVAAYGQKLRADPWLGEGMDWAAIERLAAGVADDGDGLRREFAALVGQAGKTGSVAGGR